MIRRLFCLCLGIMMCAAPLQAQISAVDPLFMPRLPQYTAYGMSGVAADLGAESALINPAVLAAVTSNIAAYAQGTLFGELNTSTFMLSRLGEIGGGGISLYYTMAQSVAIHITDDNDYDGHPNRTGSFRNSYQGVLLSYYREIGNGLSAEAGIKHVVTSIDKNSATGIGFHAGIATGWASTPLGAVRGGAALYNAGSTALAWDTGTSDTIDQTVCLGGALQTSVSGYKVNVAADYDLCEGLSFGAQIGYPELGIRAQGGLSSIGSSFGCAYEYQQLTFSLAYLSHQALGGSYSFSIAYVLDIKTPSRRTRSFTIDRTLDIPGYPPGVKDTPDDVIELPAPEPVPDIREELERFRQTGSRAEAIQQVAPCEVQFVPSMLRAGEEVRLNVEVLPAVERVASVEAVLGNRSVDLLEQEDIAGLGSFSSSIRSFVRKVENVTYTGLVHLPDAPGRYELIIRIAADGQMHEVRKTITVE